MSAQRLLLALLILGTPFAAGAETIVSESFDEYQNGNLIGQGTWTGNTFPTPDSWLVVDTAECDSGKCIVSNALYRNVTIPVSGLPEADIGFRIRIASGTTDGSLYIQFSTEGGGGWLRFTKTDDEFAVIDTVDATLFAGLSMDVWHDVAIERFMPEDGCALRVSIDGGAVVEGVYANPQICSLYKFDPSGEPIIEFSLHSELEPQVYIDDITLSSIGTSEPSAPDPVIIIPGILGSEKNSDGEWVIDPILHTYDDLIATLDVNHYTPDVDLFTFPYDWRKSNIETAVLLKQKIDEVKAICGCDKVDLVAHSMGGLVARQYIQSDAYDQDVDQLIFLGTPHLGAPKAYLMWEGGRTDPQGVDNFVLQRILDQEAYEKGYSSLFDYVHNGPILSAQELLPVYDYIFDGNNLQDYPTNYPINTFLENLNENVSVLLNSGVDIHNFWSNTANSDTITAISVVDAPQYSPMWSNGYPNGFYEGIGNRGIERGSGDSTVPSGSASFIQANPVVLTSAHNALPDNSKATVYKTLVGEEAEVIVDNFNFINIKLILIKMLSPADMLVIAPDGKKIGKENGQAINQIPGAFYSGFNTDTEYITILNPLDGEYKVVTEGTGSGSYTVEAAYVSEQSSAEASFTGNTVPGQVSALIVPVDNQNPETIEILSPDEEEPSLNELIALIKAKILALTAKDKLKQNLVKKIESLEKKIEKKKQKNPKLLTKIDTKITKQVAKGKIAALDADAVAALLDELEAQAEDITLDTDILTGLKAAIQALDVKANVMKNLLKRVERLDGQQRLTKTLSNLTMNITKKTVNGKLLDSDALQLIDLLSQIESAL